jgi:membrane-associated phospholipid phosphatase
VTSPLRLKPIEALEISFLALLSALVVIFNGRVPGAGILVARYAGVIAMVALAAWARISLPESAPIRYINVFMPVFVIMFTFDSLGTLTHHVNPTDMDPALARLDLAIFGQPPGVLLEHAIHPVLTTVLQLCYTSYYFLPIALCLILWFSRERGKFDRAVFGITLGFFASYIGYLLVPALGPRVYIHNAFTHDLMRGPLATGINNTLNMLEGENRDAFPSGHTEIVLIVLYYAWAYRRWFFWLGLPLVTGLIFSTVYLRYHYFVDVAAGVALAPLCVWAATALYDRYDGKAG